MPDFNIDQFVSAEFKALSEAPVDQEQPATTENEREPQQENDVVEENAVSETEEESQEDAQESDAQEQPWPKKAVNALDRAKKNNFKLKQQLTELQQKLAQLQKVDEKQDAPAAPNQDDFDDFDAYLEASVAHKYEAKETKAKEAARLAEIEQLQQQQRQMMQKRVQDVTAEFVDLAKQNKEFASAILEAAPILDALPAEQQILFYQLDNPVAAAYALAKEGGLEILAAVPVQVAAAKLQVAQMRGEKLLNQQPNNTQQQFSAPTTKAPAPMKPVTGGGRGERELHELSGDELLKRLGLYG